MIFPLLLLTGCIGSSFSLLDHDGDGFSPLEGDCWDAEVGPPGSGLTGADIHPGATETFYDGVDQDCAGDDDYDADGDGFVSDAYAGLSDLPPGDCWDLPDEVPAAFTVVSSDLTDKEGTPLAWVQPTAAEVNPAASDTWYDGVDQDCAGDDDFDQDGDGFRTEAYPSQAGEYGEDCIDGSALDDENIAGTPAGEVNPAAAETWYDGTDQDCDDTDCDQDGDGYDYDGSAFCEREECDDTDPDVFPNGEPERVWYDGQDDNCDGNDGDQDGDGFWVADYEERVAASGSGYPPLEIPAGMEGDCWDDPVEVPEEFTALNGLPQPDAAEVYPGADDACYDGVDQDCAGGDEFDQDGDGYAHDTWADRDGQVGDDCDDEDGAVHPGQIEAFYDGTDDDCDGNDGDMDGDGYWHADYEGLVAASGGSPLSIPSDCGPSGTASCEGDCDDSDAAVHPGATEAVNGIDDDCNGVVDDGTSTWYADSDADGYGDPTVTITAASPPPGYVADPSDCDDADAGVHPGATEIVANGTDEDCDGVDSCYQDLDNDNYGTSTVIDGSSLDCTAGTGAPVATDCDDTSAGAHPGATEIVANGDDEDCDGVDSCYQDLDGDNYGTSIVIVGSSLDCTTGTGAPVATDCDDTDAGVHPGATEIVGNGSDEDCDGVEVCYYDADDDGYLSSAPRTRTSTDADCTDAYEGLSTDPWTDCDDTDAGDYPGATEIVANGDDEDCDGVDACYQDLDDDNYGTSTVIDGSSLDCATGTGAPVATDCDDADAGVHPGATEIVGDGTDEDCDGVEVCYFDADDDGYLSSAPRTRVSTDSDCTDAYEGTHTDPWTDCDDFDAAVNPGGYDVYNGVDDDCDGDIDEVLDGDASVSLADAILSGSGAAGTSLAVEDFDGDGSPDLLIGAYAESTYGYYRGAGYVASGPFSGSIALATTAAFRYGEAVNDQVGYGVAAGDVDGDGYGDAVLGAYGEDSGGVGAGAVYLVMGPIAGSASLATADSKLVGVAGDQAGMSVATGDLDADGLADLLVGAPSSDPGGTDSGIVYLVTGGVTSTTTLSGSTGRLVGVDAYDSAGMKVGAADMDGDGYDDALVGATWGGTTDAGAAYIVCGPIRGTFDLSGADATLLGVTAADWTGASIAAGDVDGDGTEDLLVGAAREDSGGADAGAAYLVLGPVFGSVALSAADAKLIGEAAGDKAYEVTAGDLDADGNDDVLVGAPYAGLGGTWSGATYLLFGPVTGTVDLSLADARLIGATTYDYVGDAVDAADLTGDGIDDAIVSGTGVSSVYLFAGWGP